MSEEIPSSDSLPLVALKRNNWLNKIKTCVSRDSMGLFYLCASIALFNLARQISHKMSFSLCEGSCLF